MIKKNKKLKFVLTFCLSVFMLFCGLLTVTTYAPIVARAEVVTVSVDDYYFGTSGSDNVLYIKDKYTPENLTIVLTYNSVDYTFNVDGYQTSGEYAGIWFDGSNDSENYTAMSYTSLNGNSNDFNVVAGYNTYLFMDSLSINITSETYLTSINADIPTQSEITTSGVTTTIITAFTQMLGGIGTSISSFFGTIVLDGDGELTAFATWGLVFFGVAVAIGILSALLRKVG